MIKKFDFNKTVILESYNQPVIVEFSSPGCGPCQWMEKTLVEVVKDLKDQVHFVSIPISQCEDCIEKYNISANPTTILFDKGAAKTRLTGALPAMAVKQWIQDHIL